MSLRIRSSRAGALDRAVVRGNVRRSTGIALVAVALSAVAIQAVDLRK